MTHPLNGRRDRAPGRGIVVWRLLLFVALTAAAVVVVRHEWERLRAREEQQEAKDALRELAAKMDAYKEAHGAYTTDLVAIGYAPPRGARYVVGFTVPHYPAAAAPAEDFRSFTGFVETRRRDPRGAWDHARQVRSDGRYLNPFDLVAQDAGRGIVPQATDGCFLAGAAADLDGDPGLDVWTIDCRGWLAHVVDGRTGRVVEWPRAEGFSDSVESARTRERQARDAATVAAATPGRR